METWLRCSTWCLITRSVSTLTCLDSSSYEQRQVEFKVDTSNPQARRSTFDWNSKKAGMSYAIHCLLG